MFAAGQTGECKSQRTNWMVSEHSLPELVYALHQSWDRSVKLVGYGFLFDEGEVAELFAEVAVNHVFERVHGAPERSMVSTTQRLRLKLHVHLEVDKQVDLLPGFERHEATDGAH